MKESRLRTTEIMQENSGGVRDRLRIGDFESVRRLDLVWQHSGNYIRFLLKEDAKSLVLYSLRKIGPSLR